MSESHLPFADIIWNITQLCGWDCAFCCVDAVHVRREGNALHLRKHSLTETESVDASDSAFDEVRSRLTPYGVTPTAMDIALVKRQQRGDELTFDQKLAVLANLSGFRLKMDIAGGDPLGCYENFLIIKRAAELFGRESIAVTTTGLVVTARYDLNELASAIGQIEFTYDEPTVTQAIARPSGYNKVNLKMAAKFAALGVKTKAQLPVHRGNCDLRLIERLYLDLHEHCIDRVLLMRIFPVGRGMNNVEREWQIQPYEYASIIAHLKGLEARYQLPRVSIQCALRHFAMPTAANPCDMVRDSFGLNPRGVLLSCVWATNAKGEPLSDAFVLGNLATHHLNEILATEKVSVYREALDRNFGHCKIFAFLASETRDLSSLFEKADPLYAT